MKLKTPRTRRRANFPAPPAPAAPQHDAHILPWAQAKARAKGWLPPVQHEPAPPAPKPESVEDYLVRQEAKDTAEHFAAVELATAPPFKTLRDQRREAYEEMRAALQNLKNAWEGYADWRVQQARDEIIGRYQHRLIEVNA
jgi:hypothetical protein